MTHQPAQTRLISGLRHGSGLSKALSDIQRHAGADLSLERCAMAVGKILGWFQFEILRPSERTDRSLDNLSTEDRDWSPDFPEASDPSSAFAAFDEVLERTMVTARSCEVDGRPSSEEFSQLAKLVLECQAASVAVRSQGAP